MLIRHFRRHRLPPRSGLPGRALKASDAILIMLAALLVAAALYKMIFDQSL